MKVKIKDVIYDSNEEPIMIILDESDKKNISDMENGAKKYCSFPDGTEIECIKNFMKIN